MQSELCLYNEGVFREDPLMTKKKIEEKNQTFGQRLAQFRKMAGLTQEGLAQTLGTTRRMIAYYETETDSYQPAHLFSKMAKVFGITTDELLGLKQSKSNGKKPPRRLLRRLEQIEELPSRHQRTLLQTIDAYLKGVRPSNQ